jgi:hypothetical protein
MVGLLSFLIIGNSFPVLNQSPRLTENYQLGYREGLDDQRENTRRDITVVSLIALSSVVLLIFLNNLIWVIALARVRKTYHKVLFKQLEEKNK